MSGIMKANSNDNTTTLAMKRKLLKEKAVPIVLEQDRECDDCVLKDRCPNYRAGERCILNFMVPIEDGGDITVAMQILLEQQYARLQRALYIENQEGGYPNKDVNELIKDFVNTIKELKEMIDPTDEFTVKAKGKNGTAFIANLLKGGNNG